MLYKLLSNNVLRCLCSRGRFSCLRGVVVGLVVFLAVNLFCAPVQAQSRRYTSKRLELPRSHLNAPYEAAVYLGGYGQLGGGLSHEQGQPGGGAFIMFRPARANDFFTFLYDWNCSLSLQADYQRVAPESRLKSADLVLRHYLQDMRGSGRQVAPFIGFGVGASSALKAPGQSPRMSRYWSWLVEAGQEWDLDGRVMIFFKLQFRRFSQPDFSFSTWSAAAGAALPLPW